MKCFWQESPAAWNCWHWSRRVSEENIVRGRLGMTLSLFFRARSEENHAKITLYCNYFKRCNAVRSQIISGAENGKHRKTYHCDMGNSLSVILLEKRRNPICSTKVWNSMRFFPFPMLTGSTLSGHLRTDTARISTFRFPQKHRNLWKEGAADVFGKPLSDQKNP